MNSFFFLAVTKPTRIKRTNKMNKNSSTTHSQGYRKTKTKKSIVKEQWDPISNQSTRKREKNRKKKFYVSLNSYNKRNRIIQKKIIIKLRIFSYSIVIYSQFNFLYNLHTHFVFFIILLMKENNKKVVF